MELLGYSNLYQIRKRNTAPETKHSGRRRLRRAECVCFLARSNGLATALAGTHNIHTLCYIHHSLLYPLCDHSQRWVHGAADVGARRPDDREFLTNHDRVKLANLREFTSCWADGSRAAGHAWRLTHSAPTSKGEST